MSNLELAQEALEKAHHHGHGHDAPPPNSLNKYAAIMVAMLAAIAVVVEMSANDAQVAYLANHISASDTWSQYQAKSIRRAVFLETAEMLEQQSGPTPDPAQTKRITSARDQAERMQNDPGKDGMKQLAEKAHLSEEIREHELKLHDSYELSARGLQIGIVLSGLFIVTQFIWLMIGGGILGLIATGYGALVAAGLM